MEKAVSLLGVMLYGAFLVGCGGNGCAITAAVTPTHATADHSAAAPANQAQFSTESAASPNCPLVADKVGSWSTSDPVNTTISNQAPTQGLATCLNATPNPVRIDNSGNVRGHAMRPATLTCN